MYLNFLNVDLIFMNDFEEKYRVKVVVIGNYNDFVVL